MSRKKTEERKVPEADVEIRETLDPLGLPTWIAVQPQWLERDGETDPPEGVTVMIGVSRKDDWQHPEPAWNCIALTKEQALRVSEALQKLAAKVKP